MKPGALALLGAVVALPAAAVPADWPEVACHVAYGGETRIVRTDGTRHALDVPPTPIGSYFLFRPVVEVSPAGQPRRFALRLPFECRTPACIISRSPNAAGPPAR